MNLAGFTDFVLPFLLLLGALIFIHELGHFLVAKWFDVKVEKFSLGFGPSLLRRQVGETEYVIAALPLGGFVKMLGEIPGEEELAPEERDRAFNYKPVYQRIAIALAGPVMNFLLPIVLIAGMLMTGIPTLTTKVGAIAPDSPAEAAGVESGDRIVGIDGEEIWRWADLTQALRRSHAPQVTLSLERDGARREVVLERTRLDGGSYAPLGVEPSAPSAVFGVPDPESPAGLAGMQTGDRLLAINGEPVEDRYHAERKLAGMSGPLELEVARERGEDEETLKLTVAGRGAWNAQRLGVIPVDFAVSFVDPASPARRAGVENGDIFLRAEGAVVKSWEQIVEAIRGSQGEPVQITVLRAGEPVDLVVEPSERAVQVAEGEVETHFAIGIGGGMLREPGELRDDVVRNPFVALWRGTQRTGEIVMMILGGIAQLVTGNVGLDNLAGPIGIGEIAADSFQVSWLQFFSFMAIISVNLAILNLLPIPILDGGQIVLAAAEGIKGSPLPMRAREIAQTVGLSLILVLMGFAFWNDLSRHWAGIVGFLKDLV